MSLFPKKEFDLPQLLKLIEINRERIVLKAIANNADIRSISKFNSDSLWLDRIELKTISKGYEDIFIYLVKNYDKLEKSQQEYYFDLNPKTILSKKDSWAYAYPYFIDEAYKYNKKLFKKLMEKIENSNNLYLSEVKKIKDEGRGESTWIENQIRCLNEKYYQVFVLKDTVLEAIESEDYDTAHCLNNFTKEKIDEDVFEQAKISKNKKLSDKEKQLLHCIHNGVVCIDELIALNDYDLYEKTIKEYPISIYEKGFQYIDKKDYKSLFAFVNEIGGFDSVIEDLKNKTIEKLHNDYEKSLGHLDSSKALNSKYLRKYIYDNHRGVMSSTLINKKLGMDTSATKENFKSAKNYLFLNSVLDKDIRFIEKACKTANQQELDDALTKVAPNNFKAINILLNFGAKLHKTWTEDDGWGYMVNRDEIDEIGTEILKKKIKDVLGEK